MQWLYRGIAVLPTISPTKQSDALDTFGEFAAERQRVFFRKLQGYPPPWTEDTIIRRHKFTNAYRASDRVSQYLIRHVIYQGDQTPEEVFFRTILFKLFNKIDTWELWTSKLGFPTFNEYSFVHYDEIYVEAMRTGTAIYSGAYIMPSGSRTFGYREKHRTHLKLLESMMEDHVADQIAEAPSSPPLLY